MEVILYIIPMIILNVNKFYSPLVNIRFYEFFHVVFFKNILNVH